ncbi:DUF502 domain-containing protein [Arenibaculum pallidiluteum]|uniref:DUF502 domain-containing protein n=1 Tax=Arenibaculum pallidiluteum TaxID=2812559 RepID=UPI001A97587E|nr:DUF502 domain-containing protein [Arenibaculum pallidiluteum]
MSLSGRLRAYFLAGCLVTAPLALTFWLVQLLLGATDQWIDALLPASLRPDAFLPFAVPGLGLVIVLIAVTLAGMLTAGWIGVWVVRLGEAILVRTPILRPIYGTAKQVVAAVISSSGSPRQVVALEYPRPGSWTLGFVTGPSTAEMRAISGSALVAVLVPSTPNPTGAYLLFVDPAELVPVDMPAEDAVKLIVSGGIWKPPPRPAG